MDLPPNSDTPPPPPHTSSSSTLLSHAMFRKLPIQVQRDLRETDRLATEDICRTLLKGAEWIPARNLAGYEHWDSTTPDTQTNSDDANTQRTHHRLQRMSEDRQRANKRLKAAIQESRNTARDVCADVFVLQDQLHAEGVSQTTISHNIANVVGLDPMDGIVGQDDIAADSEVNRRETGRKRRRSTTLYHTVVVDTSGRFKRRGLDTPRVQHPITRPTILNYTSDDDENDGTYSDSNGTQADFVDDLYEFYNPRGRSPEAELFIWNWTRESEKEEEESDDDSDDSPTGTPWRCLPDFEDDSSDPDYELRDWDLEDVWELDNPPTLKTTVLHSLYVNNFGDALNDCCGFLSDGGVSTDDSDGDHRDLSIIQRPSRAIFPHKEENFPLSLGPLLTYFRISRYNTLGFRIDDEHFEEMKRSKLQEGRHDAWIRVKRRLEHGDFLSLDLEHRLADILGSGHRRFYFDDVEWRRFENH